MRKVKYVKSVSDTCVVYGIKRGDVLVVLEEYNPGTPNNSYRFDRFYGGHSVFSGAIQYFIPIGCPCEVRNCLKHTKTHEY